MTMSDLGFSMTTESPRRTDPRKRGRGAVVLAVIVFVLVLAAIGAFLLRDRLFTPAPEDYVGSGSGEVVVEVVEGQTLADIGGTLKEEGVVASVQAFVNAAAGSDQARTIGPGFYTLAERMSAQSALATMLDPEARLVTRVTLPEGLRLDQVVTRLSKASDIPKARFRAALRDGDALGLPKWAKGNAEGFLFPATYEFPPKTSARAMVKAMVDRYNETAAALDFQAAAGRTGFTAHDVMVIASLVQAEGHPDDYAKVSRVVYNRLDEGMPLQLDATVNYALRSSEINLSPQQIDTDSPYNTYRNTGLPPTPINQPGEAAMAAALEPEDGDWLYFVSVNPDTGRTKFTGDYNEFLQFKAEFERYIADNP
jgi:UPF0755 protein